MGEVAEHELRQRVRASQVEGISLFTSTLLVTKSRGWADAELGCVGQLASRRVAWYCNNRTRCVYSFNMRERQPSLFGTVNIRDSMYYYYTSPAGASHHIPKSLE
jgi:hypothetical protein